MGSEPENVQLRDGPRVTIRSVAPRDEASLRSFLAGLCPEARYLRFFNDAALPANRAMLEVFRGGFDANVVLRDGVDMVGFPTSAWRMANGRFPTTRLEPLRGHGYPSKRMIDHHLTWRRRPTCATANLEAPTSRCRRYRLDRG